MDCDETTRPEAVEPGERWRWQEVVIKPHDRRTSPDGEWLQWTPEECVVLPRLLGLALAFLWPLLRLVDTGRFDLGRRTDW